MRRFINFLAIALLLMGAFASTQELERPPETIKFESGPAPEHYGNLSTILFGAETSKNGVTTASASLGLTLKVPRAGRQEFNYILEGIKKGDVVPVMGELYRVEYVQPKRPAEMALRRIERDKWPEKVSTTSAGIAVFLRPGRLGSSTEFPTNGGIRLSVLGIEGGTEKKAALSANLMVSRETKIGFKSTEATVKVDDILLINGKGHKVLSIVPANEKTRVVGWVELDPNGVPEADLKRDKKAYVTPVKK